MKSEKSDPATNRELDWAALLARCTEFAKSAVALPTDGEAGRYRRSVPPLITLHAVTHALGELDRLPADEVPLALDRAEILIREAAAELDEIWAGEPPEALIPFLTDAAEALDAGLDGHAGEPIGVEWVVKSDSATFEHPGELALSLAALGLAIDLYLPSPGVPLFRGSVAGVLDLRGLGDAPDDGPDDSDATAEPTTETEDAALRAIALVALFLGDAVGEPGAAMERRQVYRQFDFAAGGPVRDVVAPESAGGQPGQALLVPVLLGGEVQPVPMPHRGREPMAPIPVEFLDA